MVTTTTSKDVLIKLRYQVEGEDKIKKTEKSIKELNIPIKDLDKSLLKQRRTQKFFEEQMQRTGKTGAEIKRGFGLMGGQFDEFGNVINQDGKHFKNINHQMDRAISKAQPFKMEYLGVMFAGMALQKTFAGLTQTSKEWVGMNEIMSNAMGIVTLPATLSLLENGILPLSNALMNLPEPVQNVIGSMALLGEGLGGALATFGQVILGLSSFKLAFPKATAKIALMTSSVFSLTTALVAVPVALAAITFAAHIKGLARTSEAYNKLGEDIRDTTDALGQYGQMSRETKNRAPGGAKEASENLSFESLGITGTPISDENYYKKFITPVTNFNNYPGLFDLLANNQTSLAVGGVIPENGLYRMHQGETVLRKDQSNNEQSINVTYNVTASSMREFESMLRESERRITQDIRRQAR